MRKRRINRKVTQHEATMTAIKNLEQSVLRLRNEVRSQKSENIQELRTMFTISGYEVQMMGQSDAMRMAERKITEQISDFLMKHGAVKIEQHEDTIMGGSAYIGKLKIVAE